MTYGYEAPLEEPAPSLGDYVTNAEILNRLDAYLRSISDLLAELEYVNPMIINKHSSIVPENQLMLALMPDLRQRLIDGAGIGSESSVVAEDVDPL